MKFEDRVCCMCDKHKKFLASINAGTKLYCLDCQRKIEKEYGMEYWKSCSFEEFLKAVPKTMGKSNGFESTNMFSGIKKTLNLD